LNELEKIVAATTAQVARRKDELPLSELERAAAARSRAADARSFHDAIARPGLSLIAEHKRRSPSAGLIREELAVQDVVRAYERGGARALSVLTDEPSFGGSLADLETARATAALPILRKDFIVDTYQVVESFAAGADAILLIVAALSQAQLAALQAAASALGLDVLVEVHDERELDLALTQGARMIGINNRDLTTLGVDTRRTFELLPRIRGGALIVAESGFSARGQLEELSRAGLDGVLIGEALMRAPDVEAACRELTC